MVVAICVHNRFENIKVWINCWKVCEHNGAELVIIHNHYGDQLLKSKFEDYCKKNGVRYVGRNKPGYDIGAFQDVCRGRLDGFPDFDKLLWCCDDTLPMAKDFISPFLNKLTDEVGVVCMDISPYVRPHIRTTGFLIRRETMERLTFEVDPISTKEDCYRFEHRDPVNWFCNQIRKMGCSVAMVDSRDKSPLWDAGYHRGLKRRPEHEKVFPNRSKVVFVCPIFDAFPEIISSLICQTHKEWELLLIDDNPNGSTTKAIIEATGDKRITYIKRPRVEKWGHPLRQWALQEIKDERLAAGAEYVVITNGDNFHVPVYTEYLLKGFASNPAAVASYCSDMVHSYTAWNVIPCRLQLGFIDCAGVMVRKDVACEVGWRDVDGHSSDWTYFKDIITKHGADKWAKVKGCLLIHNALWPIFILACALNI